MVPAEQHDIVITGVGVVSPIGVGRADFWRSLVQQQGGVAPLTRDFGDHPVHYGGELRDFDPKAYVVPRKSIKLMCREIQTAYAAAILAVADAQLDAVSVDSDRFGVTFGSEMMYGLPCELAQLYANSACDGTADIRLFGERFTQDLFPLWMLSYLPNMAACHIAISQQAFGANNTIVQGDASPLLAMSEAVSVIRRGWADIMICGGTGTRLNITHRAHVTIDSLSTNNSNPTRTPRPFDAGSDGEVLGEGAGAIVIETRAHAESRGATPLAQILGCASSFGAADESLEGASTIAIEQAIRIAIQRAGCEKSEIDHVNAHGVARPKWDQREAHAIHAVLPGVPVMAPKSYFGNLGAGSGSVEAIASILAFVEGWVPGLLNHERTDPNCPVKVIGRSGQTCERPASVLINQSTTGQVAAIVLGREPQTG